MVKHTLHTNGKITDANGVWVALLVGRELHINGWVQVFQVENSQHAMELVGYIL